MKKSLLLALILLSSITNGFSLIVYQNSNTTAPEEMPYWDNVINFSGASGVYLGDGWILTANHVGTPGNVTIQGNSYTVAAGSSQQINTRDLKLFRVQNYEPISLTNVSYTTGWTNNPTTGLNQADGHIVTAIGYGVGKGTTTTSGWNWNSTYQKQWGLMTSEASGNTITHLFDRTLGANASTATLGDSGGGTFYQDSNGWHLSGIITNVTSGGSSQYDTIPGLSGDQPDQTLSQNLAGKNGAEIYRITGIWGSQGTTATANGTTWSGNPATAERIILSGTSSLTKTQSALIDAAGESEITSEKIGTLLLRENSQSTISGNTEIQILIAENNTSINLEDSNSSIRDATLTNTNLSVKNTTLVLHSQELKVKSLTVENSTVTSERLQAENLRIKAGGNLQNNDATYFTVLGTGEGVWNNYAITVSNSVIIEEGAIGSTANFIQGENTLLQVDGTLKVEGPGPISLHAGNTIFAEDAHIVFNLGTSPGDGIFGGRSRFATASILGDETFEFRGSLNILNSHLASSNYTYTLFQSNQEGGLDLLFNNLSPDGLLTTDSGTFLITKTWDGNLEKILASNYAPIPEPNTILLILAGVSGLLVYRKKSGR